MRTISAAAATAAFALLVVASPAAADCEKEPGKNLPKKCYEDPDLLAPVSPASTPELGSLLLFGSGLVGAGGYALTRIRAARRPD